MQFASNNWLLYLGKQLLFYKYINSLFYVNWHRMNKSMMQNDAKWDKEKTYLRNMIDKPARQLMWLVISNLILL